MGLLGERKSGKRYALAMIIAKKMLIKPDLKIVITEPILANQVREILAELKGASNGT